jgi:hypothetical protein
LNNERARRQPALAQHGDGAPAMEPAEIIDGCARHGIRGISPWRDQVRRRD